MTLFLHKF